MTHSKGALSTGPVYAKETMLDGSPVSLQCIDVGSNTFSLRRGLISRVELEEEWYADVEDPVAVVAALSSQKRAVADLLTFWQRYPDVEAKYPYHLEWEELALLRIDTYEDWWQRRVKPQVRNKIRKSERAGLSVREVPFDDDFVRGMTAIFAESPIRQGRKFWHYGKSFDTVKSQFSRCTYRETMIGAYLGDEMIGFVMLADAGKFAIPTQIIASLHHRDKGASNALMAKSIEVCARKHQDMIYMYWGEDSLADFKRSCGFEAVRVPRYWVPLTAKGRFALSRGLHHGWKSMVPPATRERLKGLRRRWLERVTR